MVTVADIHHRDVQPKAAQKPQPVTILDWTLLLTARAGSKILHVKKVGVALLLLMLLIPWDSGAVEGKRYRLLSIANISKLILVSEIPTKAKFVVDASTAKITVDGKPAEFQDLKAYTVIRVTFETKKGSKDGIDIDGVAREITISTPESVK